MNQIAVSSRPHCWPISPAKIRESAPSSASCGCLTSIYLAPSLIPGKLGASRVFSSFSLLNWSKLTFRWQAGDWSTGDKGCQAGASLQISFQLGDLLACGRGSPRPPPQTDGGSRCVVMLVTGTVLSVSPMAILLHLCFVSRSNTKASKTPRFRRTEGAEKKVVQDCNRGQNNVSFTQTSYFVHIYYGGFRIWL